MHFTVSNNRKTTKINTTSNTELHGFREFLLLNCLLFLIVLRCCLVLSFQFAFVLQLIPFFQMASGYERSSGLLCGNKLLQGRTQKEVPIIRSDTIDVYDIKNYDSRRESDFHSEPRPSFQSAEEKRKKKKKERKRGGRKNNVEEISDLAVFLPTYERETRLACNVITIGAAYLTMHEGRGYVAERPNCIYCNIT